MKRRYIVLAIINGAALLAFAIFTAVFSGLAGSLPDQRVCERWAAGELRYAQISVFNEESSAMDINSVFTERVNIDKKLVENSLVSEREGARLWTDAFSSTQEKISVNTEHGSAEAKLIVTGGDFFLFHPLDIISGYYYSDDGVMQDRVLIDDILAWQLYGSSDVAGMPVSINGKYFFISGVFKKSDNSDVEKVYGTSPRIFMSYEGYSLLGREAKFTCYEACLPNQVTGQAKGIITDTLSITENSLGTLVVENSARYSLKNRFSIIRNFGLRSVVDRPVVYPMWENAARITEDKSALLLVIQIICLILPIGTVIYLIAKLYRNRKKLLKRLIDAVKSVFDKSRQKIYDRKKSKSKSADSVLPS